MPYFSRLRADVPNEWRMRNSWFSPPDAVGKASVRYTAFSTLRTGSNSSHLDLFRLYDGKVDFHYYHKKTLMGTRPKRVFYFVYYRDDKGRSRRKRKYKVIQVPNYVRVPVVSKVTRTGDAPRNKNRFLKPNRLFFSQTTNVVVPNDVVTAIKYTHDYLGSTYGTFVTSGCGAFNRNGVYRQIGFSNPLEIQAIDVSQSLKDEALRKLYGKVNSSIPQYLTAAAESPKLIKQLKSILKGGLTFFRAIKKLEFGAYTKNLSVDPTELQKMWLGWIYGISPVVSDIQDTLALVKDNERVWRSYHASSTLESLSSAPATDLIATKSYELRKTTAKYGVIIEGRLGFDEVKSQTLSVEELISTGYELIPFSFMLDWAVPIGDYLASARVFDDLSYHSWQTSVLTVNRYVQGYHDRTVEEGPNSRFRQTSSSTEYDQFAFAVQRNPISVLPDMPDIKVKTPATDMTWFKRAINAAFIASVRTGGFKAPIR